MSASNSNTDDTSLASHSCTSCNSIEQVLEALDARQQYESEYQLTKPHDIGFHKGTAYAYGQAIDLINRLLLNNVLNDEPHKEQKPVFKTPSPQKERESKEKRDPPCGN